MIILIAGSSHTGKTILAQRILEEYKIPYMSLDHLKMGLIRSGETNLTSSDDNGLTPFLWNITKEIIKTAIENKQHLVIEGCYIPFNWQNDFDSVYLKEITYYCLIMTESYINENFSLIKREANIVEQRIDGSYLTAEMLIKDNADNLKGCKRFKLPYLLIDKSYEVELPILKIDRS